MTVNGERYRRMITEFLLPQLEDLEEEDLWFQQDGATCHTARQTTQLLRDKFPDRLISSNGDYRWPPRSCDLSPLDFFLWGFVKSRAYKSKPNTIAQLKNEIRNVISEIIQNLCQRVIEHFLQRIRVCSDCRGGHLKDIVFHN